MLPTRASGALVLLLFASSVNLALAANGVQGVSAPSGGRGLQASGTIIKWYGGGSEDELHESVVNALPLGRTCDNADWARDGMVNVLLRNASRSSAPFQFVIGAWRQYWVLGMKESAGAAAYARLRGDVLFSPDGGSHWFCRGRHDGIVARAGSTAFSFHHRSQDDPLQPPTICITGGRPFYCNASSSAPSDPAAPCSLLPAVANVSCTVDGATWVDAAPLPTAVSGAVMVRLPMPDGGEYHALVSGWREDQSEDMLVAVRGYHDSLQAPVPIGWRRLPLSQPLLQRARMLHTWLPNQRQLMIAGGVIRISLAPDGGGGGGEVGKRRRRRLAGEAAGSGTSSNNSFVNNTDRSVSHGAAGLRDGDDSAIVGNNTTATDDAVDKGPSPFYGNEGTTAATEPLTGLDLETGGSSDDYPMVDMMTLDTQSALAAMEVAEAAGGNTSGVVVNVQRLSLRLPETRTAVSGRSYALLARPTVSELNGDVVLLHAGVRVYSVLQGGEFIGQEFQQRRHQIFAGFEGRNFPVYELQSRADVLHAPAWDDAEFGHWVAADGLNGRIFRATMEECRRLSCGTGNWSGPCSFSPYDGRCMPCTACGQGYTESQVCTPTQDATCVKCASCPDGQIMILECGAPGNPSAREHVCREIGAAAAQIPRQPLLTASQTAITAAAVGAQAALLALIAAVLVPPAAWRLSSGGDHGSSGGNNSNRG